MPFIVPAAKFIGRIALPTAYKVIKSGKILKAGGGKRGVAYFLIRTKIGKEILEFGGSKLVDISIIKGYDAIAPAGTRKDATEALAQMIAGTKKIARDPSLVRNIQWGEDFKLIRDFAPVAFLPFVQGRVVNDALVSEGVSPWIITAVGLVT